MGHDELIAEINKDIDQAASVKDYYPVKMLQAIRAIVDLHRPITTKKASEYAVNCMTCIVASHNGGWKNRKYPCPTIELVMKGLP